MKCEVCKKNDAQFYYKESINGKTTEKHLCAECAHKEGLDHVFDQRMNTMFNSFGRMMENFLQPDVDFFGFGRLPSFGEMFEPFTPLLEYGGTEEAENKSGEDKQHELEELKTKLHDAVEREDFETAIELRDKIRSMEK